MTGRWAAFAFVLALVQAPDLGRLAEQLGSDDSSLRQQAERRLLDIGEPARATLERLGRSKDAEVSERAKAVLATLDRAALRRKYLGPSWTVTLPEGEVLLGDLPGLLKPQVPASLQIPAAASSARIRIAAKDTPVWEFLDRVCAAHGGLTVPLERPDGAFALVEGKPAGAPTSYSGPFRIWIDRLILEERHDWRGCRLVYGITWQPNVDPMNEGIFSSLAFRLREATDGAGKELKVDVDRSFREGAFSLDVHRKGVARGYVDFAAPPAGVRRWGRLKGSVRMEFPSKVAQIEFRDPAQSVGKTVQAGSTAITLAEFRPADGGVVASLFFRRTWKPEDASVERHRLELRARVQEDSIVLRGASGAGVEFDSRASSHSSSDEEETQEYKGFFKIAEEARMLSFPFVADTFEHEVPFEFRDVEVP